MLKVSLRLTTRGVRNEGRASDQRRDTGGAKTHILSLLSNIATRVDIHMVCFMDGPLAQEAREMGIPTTVLAGRNLLVVLKTLEGLSRMVASRSSTATAPGPT